MHSVVLPLTALMWFGAAAPRPAYALSAPASNRLERVAAADEADLSREVEGDLSEHDSHDTGHDLADLNEREREGPEGEGLHEGVEREHGGESEHEGAGEDRGGGEVEHGDRPGGGGGGESEMSGHGV